MTVYWLALIPFMGLIFLLTSLILDTSGDPDV